jgi:glycosyltransferase involved in cell wall biosynthesis
MASRSAVRVEAGGSRAGENPRRTIVQIVSPGEVGGLESVVLALAEGQTRRGHNVVVAVVSDREDGKHPFTTALTAAGVRSVSFAVPVRAYVKERRLIKELCARENPDIVHTHGYRPDILHAASRLRRDFGTVTTLHGSSRVGGVSTLHEMLQLLVLRRFDGVIAVSRKLANELRGKAVRPERLHVIPNAWGSRIRIAERSEARRFLSLPAEGVVIGWVGRLIPIKGADVFLDAVRRLAGLPLTISIIGEGTERARLEHFVQANGLGDRVRFHGIVPDAGRYLSAFDVFVLSSRSEGTPVTLLEAMSANVPLVVTNVGGVPDVVRQAEAILVSPEDADGLARAVLSVLEDPSAASARAAAALQRLRTEFNLDDWIDAHDRVYDLIVSNRQR